MESSTVGFIIILAVCIIGVFALILGSRMRKETGTRPSATDDAFNYGRGSTALSALRAEATGLSAATVWMLVTSGLLVLSGGLALMYYGDSVGLMLLGISFASIGFAAAMRNGVSLSRTSGQKSWVMLINIANARSLMLSYYTLMSAGIILAALGLIAEVAGYEKYTTNGTVAAVLIPIAISVVFGYARVKKG